MREGEDKIIENASNTAEEDKEEKLLADQAYRVAASRLSKGFGIELNNRELIYLYDEAKKAVALDKPYREDLQKMKEQGKKESDPEYVMLNNQRPVLHFEIMKGWLDHYLGIEQPVGIDISTTPISNVDIDPEDSEADFNDRKYRSKEVGETPAEQIEAYSIARRTQRLGGNIRPITDYYHRVSMFGGNQKFNDYLKIKLEKRRAESEVSDMPEKDD